MVVPLMRDSLVVGRSMQGGAGQRQLGASQQREMTFQVPAMIEVESKEESWSFPDAWGFLVFMYDDSSSNSSRQQKVWCHHSSNYFRIRETQPQESSQRLFVPQVFSLLFAGCGGVCGGERKTRVGLFVRFSCVLSRGAI